MTTDDVLSAIQPLFILDRDKLLRMSRTGAFPAPATKLNRKLALWKREEVIRWIADHFGNPEAPVRVPNAPAKPSRVRS